MSENYERLLRDLTEYIRRAASLSSDDLLGWAGAHGIGPLTLSLLIDDVRRELDLESEGEVVVDEDLNIRIPRVLRLRGQQRTTGAELLEPVGPRQQESVRARRRARRRTERRLSLIHI